jgi:large subunit ribosomal protein L21
MYAVVEIGGHQYRVSEGDVLFVDKQKNEEAGNKLTFDKVLLINDGDGGVSIGAPTIEGASVEAELLDNVKADKVIVFKKKRRKGYQVKNGHRQPMSQIEISSISASGTAGKKKKKATAETKSPEKTEKKAKSEDKPKAEQAAKVSSDMLAKEAIEHIENTPLDQLEGFVTEDEDRVTVQRAWESKQEEE